MRRRIRNVVGAALVAGFVFPHASPSANDGPQAGSTAPAANVEQAAQYYGWLDEFENPSQPTPAASSVSRVPDQPERQAAAPIGSPSTDDPPSETVASNVVFEESTAEPGEGLGCYYHRAYYSHLPMFKDGVYSLRGSFDVAETYRKPSDDVVSSPNALTPRENGS